MLAATLALLAQTTPTTIGNNIKTAAIAIIGALLVCAVGWKLVKAIVAGGTGAVVSIALLAGIGVFVLNNPDRLGTLVDNMLKALGI